MTGFVLRLKVYRLNYPLLLVLSFEVLISNLV